MSRQGMKHEDFSVDEKRLLFTVKDRGTITRSCLDAGAWEGTRRGFKILIDYMKDRPAGAQIVWAVCINRKWHSGHVQMVSDALASVESEVANKELNARLEALDEGK